MRLHQAGALAEAEALYREVLAAEPRQVDVLNQLGVVVHQTGRDDDALDLIDRAIAIDGSNRAYFSNRGIVLGRLGRADEAVESYRRAVTRDPDNAEAFVNLVWARQEACDWAGRERDPARLRESHPSSIARMAKPPECGRKRGSRRPSQPLVNA